MDITIPFGPYILKNPVRLLQIQKNSRVEPVRKFSKIVWSKIFSEFFRRIFLDKSGRKKFRHNLIQFPKKFPDCTGPKKFPGKTPEKSPGSVHALCFTWLSVP
jgi:hypothetical protein